MVGGDADWAREIRRQLVAEIELVSSGMEQGGKLLHQDTHAQASDRIGDLRRRLEQVDRLIEAIEALRADEREANEAAQNLDDDPVIPDNAAMHGRKGRNGRSNSLAD